MKSGSSRPDSVGVTRQLRVPIVVDDMSGEAARGRCVTLRCVPAYRRIGVRLPARVEDALCVCRAEHVVLLRERVLLLVENVRAHTRHAHVQPTRVHVHVDRSRGARCAAITHRRHHSRRGEQPRLLLATECPNTPDGPPPAHLGSPRAPAAALPHLAMQQPRSP